MGNHTRSRCLVKAHDDQVPARPPKWHATAPGTWPPGSAGSGQQGHLFGRAWGTKCGYQKWPQKLALSSYSTRRRSPKMMPKSGPTFGPQNGATFWPHRCLVGGFLASHPVPHRVRVQGAPRRQPPPGHCPADPEAVGPVPAQSGPCPQGNGTRACARAPWAAEGRPQSRCLTSCDPTQQAPGHLLTAATRPHGVRPAALLRKTRCCFLVLQPSLLRHARAGLPKRPVGGRPPARPLANASLHRASALAA